MHAALDHDDRVEFAATTFVLAGKNVFREILASNLDVFITLDATEQCHARSVSFV
jgi:hypothetical protein